MTMNTYAEITYKVRGRFGWKFIHRVAETRGDLYNMLDWLDQRIKEGTVSGYIYTIIDKKWGDE